MKENKEPCSFYKLYEDCKQYLLKEPERFNGIQLRYKSSPAQTKEEPTQQELPTDGFLDKIGESILRFIPDFLKKVPDESPSRKRYNDANKKPKESP